MSENEKHPATGQPVDIVGAALSALEKAAAMDDATRLQTLEDLYRSMESELERDLDQAGPPRH